VTQRWSDAGFRRTGWRITAPGPQWARSPEWWLRRLHAEMARRCEAVELFDAYYRGDHPLPWLAPQARVTSSAASCG
jgi:hypothetical protein